MQTFGPPETVTQTLGEVAYHGVARTQQGGRFISFSLTMYNNVVCETVTVIFSNEGLLMSPLENTKDTKT